MDQRFEVSFPLFMYSFESINTCLCLNTKQQGLVFKPLGDDRIRALLSTGLPHQGAATVRVTVETESDEEDGEDGEEEAAVEVEESAAPLPLQDRASTRQLDRLQVGHIEAEPAPTLEPSLCC